MTAHGLRVVSPFPLAYSPHLKLAYSGLGDLNADVDEKKNEKRKAECNNDNTVKRGVGSGRLRKIHSTEIKLEKQGNKQAPL